MEFGADAGPGELESPGALSDGGVVEFVTIWIVTHERAGVKGHAPGDGQATRRHE